MSGRQKFYDWAADPAFTTAQTPANLPVPYAPPGVAALVPPGARVVHVPGQLPVYAYQPQPLPPYDPLPQRMAAAGIFLAGAGVCAVGVGVGSFWLFKGMSIAEHALVALAVIVVAGAVAVVAVASSGGVRIKNFYQGDNSTFRAAR